MAPRSSEPRRYSSSRKVLSMMTLVSGSLDDDEPGRVDAVHLGHAHVHEHDVGPELLGHRDGLGAVGGDAEHLHVWRRAR